MVLASAFNTPAPQTGTVAAITRLRAPGAAEIYVLRITPPRGFTHRAGQYVEIGFGALAQRAYSIANAPGEDTIEIHIKRTAGEVGVFLSAVLRTGDAVRVSTAQGDSVFDAADKRPLVLVAGGVGFTPLKAIIEAALNDDPARQIDFFWGTQSADEQYLRDYFADKQKQYDGFRFHSVTGTPVGEAAVKTLPDMAGKRIFVAGPPPMISAILPQLLAHGAERAAISYDRQTPRTAPGNDNDSAAGRTP